MKTFTVIEQATKGITFNYDKEGENALFGIPMGQGILQPFQTAGLDRATALLQYLDVVPDGEYRRVVQEQRRNDRRALVLVETAPGVDGTVKLFANTTTERYDEKAGRVVRDLNAFPPPGIEIIAERPGENEYNGPEFLVAMMPGSSFRIVRNGNLRDSHTRSKVAPELVVVWNGRWSHGIEDDPARRQDMKNWSLSVYTRKERHGRM